MGSINLTRGLWRLWLVLSVGWIGVLGHSAWKNSQCADRFEGWAVEAEKALPPAPEFTEAQVFGDSPLESAKEPPWIKAQRSRAATNRVVAGDCRVAAQQDLALALSAPLGALISGLLLLWIVAGFRRPESTK